MGTVRAILMNPAYKGDMVWNRRTDGRFFRIADGVAVERKGVQGRRLEPNAEADWIITEDAHPALVPRRIWERAKKRREAMGAFGARGAPKAHEALPRARRPTSPMGRGRIERSEIRVRGDGLSGGLTPSPARCARDLSP